MHLNSIEPDIKVGAEVQEGQQIGTIGGTGEGRTNRYVPHLHYEMYINGAKINPAGLVDSSTLKDPQQMVDIKQNGIQVKLPEVVVEAPTYHKGPITIPVQLRLPSRDEIQKLQLYNER